MSGLVMTVDDVAELMEFAGRPTHRRQRVYDLVRSGDLEPIGGVPTGKLTTALRFSRARVIAYVTGEPMQPPSLSLVDGPGAA